MKAIFLKPCLFLGMMIGILAFAGCNDKNEDTPPGPVTPPPVDENAPKTAGTLKFTVKTVTANGEYSPANIVAIWIANNQDKWIKTLKMQAKERRKSLITFAAKSGYNTTDAITGSTLGLHTTHTVDWNGTNASAKQVEDGQYKVYVEFTENDGQGPITNYTFTKGTTLFTSSPANQSNFTGVSVTWTPTP